jgi:hypothetical protein
MGSWSYDFMKPLLARTFPGTTITYDDHKEHKPDLVVRSHFQGHERTPPYSCPYILWSGESRPVAMIPGRAPLLELNSFHSSRENEIWFPQLVAEISHTARRPGGDPFLWPKEYCCAYAFSNCVSQREELFRRMRSQENTCHAFGRSCFTPDNPFVLSRNNRAQNGEQFQPYGLIVGMENTCAPGYITEKIGYAYKAGSVPIYWGDTPTVTELFNRESFINVNDYASPTAAADYAIQVWRDPHKLRRYLDAPITLNDRLADIEAVRTEYRPWQKLFVDRLRDAFPDLS